MTAFACELGQFEWRRMPFGMCNASAKFQRAIARALRKIVNRKGSMVMAYFIPWHAKLGAPSHAITCTGTPFLWGGDQQQAFKGTKVALIEATAFAQPNFEGEFVLDTDASGVAISSILHQWQGPPIVFGSKKLTSTQAKYMAPKRCVLLHLEEPQLPMSQNVYLES